MATVMKVCIACNRNDRDIYFVYTRYSNEDNALYDSYVCHGCFVFDHQWDYCISQDARNIYAGLAPMPFMYVLRAEYTRLQRRVNKCDVLESIKHKYIKMLSASKGERRTRLMFHCLRLIMMHSAETSFIHEKNGVGFIVVKIAGKEKRSMIPSSAYRFN